MIIALVFLYFDSFLVSTNRRLHREKKKKKKKDYRISQRIASNDHQSEQVRKFSLD
jgi:hypothetical protein